MQQLLIKMVPTGYCYEDKNNRLLFVDPLGQPISSYKHLYQSIISVADNDNIYLLLANQPIKRANSILCGLFVFILLILLWMLKILFILATMNWFALLLIWCSSLTYLLKIISQKFFFHSQSEHSLNQNQSSIFYIHS